MKSYSPFVTDVLVTAAKNEEKILTPSDLDATETHGKTAHTTRVGYLNRLCNAGLLEKVDNPKLERYALTPYGIWAHKMHDRGWNFEDGYWSYEGVTIDRDAAEACLAANIVPVVSDLLEK